jgi:hypothetical protein
MSRNKSKKNIFKDKSFLHFPSLLTTPTLDYLDEVCIPYYKNSKLLQSGKLKDFYGGSIGDLSQLRLPQVDNPHLLPKLNGLPIWSQLSQIAQDLFESREAHLFASHMLIKSAFNPFIVPWHQDGVYWGEHRHTQAISFVVPTQSTDINNGCIHYYDHPYQDYLEHEKWNQTNALSVTTMLDYKKIVSCPTQAGDIIVHGPKSLHMSPANKTSNYRNIIVVIYKDNRKHDL